MELLKKFEEFIVEKPIEISKKDTRYKPELSDTIATKKGKLKKVINIKNWNQY